MEALIRTLFVLAIFWIAARIGGHFFGWSGAMMQAVFAGMTATCALYRVMRQEP
jgi:hypothetical protein